MFSILFIALALLIYRTPDLMHTNQTFYAFVYMQFLFSYHHTQSIIPSTQYYLRTLSVFNLLSLNILTRRNLEKLDLMQEAIATVEKFQKRIP